MVIKNYIITSWRNIMNHALFSIINILGLAIGLAAVMLIALYVRYETSYDTFWSKSDQIYRTHATMTIPGREPGQTVGTPGPVFHSIKDDFSEIEYAARISRERPTVIVGGEAFLDFVSFADPEIADIFDFNVLSGDLKATLNDRSSIMLDQTTAAKYFGDQTAIGEIITVTFSQYSRDFRVGAVIEDLPNNSQLNISALVVIDEEAWINDSIFQTWFGFKSQLFLQFRPDINIDEVNARFPQFIDNNFPLPNFVAPGANLSDHFELNAMNVTDLHLNSSGFGGHREQGDVNFVIIFSAVAVLILIIASINFMNLSTARASRRAKEISLRKLAGATKQNLIVQFLGEAIFLTLGALLLALVLIEFLLPIYNQTLGTTLVINYVSADFLIILSLALVVGVFSGTYPAFVLSSFRPVENLKANRSSESKSSLNLRSSMVVFQFATSITLFIATAVIYGQMLYTKTFELGYNPENLLIVQDLNREETRPKLPILVEELRRDPQIESITWARYAPGIPDDNNTPVRTPEMGAGNYMMIGFRRLGFDFFKTMEIDFIAGRDYAYSRGERELSMKEVQEGIPHPIIINEAAITELGFKNANDALGSTFYQQVGPDDQALEAVHLIIGVVPNVHLDNLKSAIRPEIYQLREGSADAIIIRYNGDPTLLVNKAERLWKQNISTVPFTYDFAESSLAKQYHSEQGQAILFALFSGLAIFIACLGLFGLAAFTAERRTKEIGIRKVFGAEVWQIVGLLVWQFSKPVLLANIIAWPLAYLAMNRWLESFVYRIDDMIIIALCLIAGLMALLIAWATVAGNSYAVARQNPIDALRYE